VPSDSLSVKEQSIDRFKTLDVWLLGFLFVALRKAWDRLVIGGHMVIHISDFKGVHGRMMTVCEPMCLFMQARLPGARYLGLMTSLGDAGRPRPMWAWERADLATAADRARVAAAEADFVRLYPSGGRPHEPPKTSELALSL